MPISRGLVISLGTSVLGCTLLFLYFRNRMSVIERKVDVMFDLIQNHNQQQQPMNFQNVNQTNVSTSGGNTGGSGGSVGSRDGSYMSLVVCWW